MIDLFTVVPNGEANGEACQCHLSMVRPVNVNGVNGEACQCQ